MKYVTYEEQGVLIEAGEIGTLKICLDYCWHRLAKHEHSGLDRAINIEKFLQLRNAINKKPKAIT